MDVKVRAVRTKHNVGIRFTGYVIWQVYGMVVYVEYANSR